MRPRRDASPAAPTSTCGRTSADGDERTGDGDRGSDLERHGEPIDERAGVDRPPISWVMIAPISAMPIEPPSWREELSTAEPTPALSTDTPLRPAAVAGAIAAPMPAPPSSMPGTRLQKLSSTPSREK